MLLKTKTDRKQFDNWIKALRSGNFSQTKSSLQDVRGFCCLGVACKVTKFKKVTNYGGFLKGGLVGDEQKNAPKWLENINDDFLKQTGKSLSNLNDNFRNELDMSFNDIADCLEAVYVHKVMH